MVRRISAIALLAFVGFTAYSATTGVRNTVAGFDSKVSSRLAQIEAQAQ